MTPKVALIGKGNVGGTLHDALKDKGYDVKAVGREPDKVKELARWGDVIVLAVPFTERENAIREMGDVYRGKVLLDVTNSAGGEGLAVEITKESGAEQVAGMARDAKVVKAFNTVFAKHMGKGEVNGEQLTLFVAGDDGDAKDVVRDIGRDLGFDAIDAGSLENARWMEALGYFNMQLGYAQEMGTDIGFKLVH